MSIFTISDLHLSFGTDKPMNIFKGWNNYTDRLAVNWKRLVTDNDAVVLPGDFSWGLRLEETVEDFKFLEQLPGKKILLKGNHDLWWSTAKKLNEFLKNNGFSSIDIVYNSCCVCQGYAIAGTRGWLYDDTSDKKILLREAGRLEASISQAEKTGFPILTFIHYPPVYGDCICHEIFNIIKNHNIKTVYHGHIHGAGCNKAVKEYDGVKFKLVSCDCVDFTPVFVV